MKEAGIGTRVINFLIDTILIFLLAFALYKWWIFYVTYWDYKFFPFYQFFHATTFVYYFLFEALFSKTPGKWLTMSKVRNTSGGKPGWYQVLLRSLTRLTIIYAFFIPILGRPLHDAISGTRLEEQ